MNSRVRRDEATISSRPLAEGQDPDREVGRARVGVRAQPALDVGFGADRRHVADVGGVALLEQPLVVRRVLRVTEGLVGRSIAAVDLVGRGQAHGDAGDDTRCRAGPRPRPPS